MPPVVASVRCARSGDGRHPAMLAQAMSDALAEPEHTVMIGDTTFDIEMGRAAGFRTLGVTWGYHSETALRKAGADILVSDFADVVAQVIAQGADEQVALLVYQERRLVFRCGLLDGAP